MTVSIQAIAHPLRRIAAMALVGIACVLAGCASLPSGVQRPVSHAQQDLDTPLTRIAGAAAPAEHAELSGLRLLPDGDHALNARIELARRAAATLDVQYYTIAADAVGLRFLRELRDAAARGVRVRLLVDDLNGTGQDELFASLAVHPNVQVRVFNPLAARAGGMVMRVARSAHEFSRINRRMHNKLFIADGAFAVVGGRNIADEYFMRGEVSNFIDIDALATGAVVAELAGVFDAYWNSEQAWPIHSLCAAPADAATRFEVLVRGAADTLPVTPLDRLGRSSVQAQLDSGRLDQAFARVKVLADVPGKAGGDTQAETTSAAAARAMASARSDLLVVSPYYVPGSRGIALLRSLLARKATLTVMTNSLGATDAPLVHHGYARYRHEMLRMGVELHEVGATLARESGSLGDFHSSLGRLHAKLLVIDHERLFIGSMNMDGRSARHNTEIGLLIDSPELAGEVARMFQAGKMDSTYRLRLAAGEQRIEWQATEGGRDVTYPNEPGAGLGLRMKLSLLSAFVAEDLL